MNTVFGALALLLLAVSIGLSATIIHRRPTRNTVIAFVAIGLTNAALALVVHTPLVQVLALGTGIALLATVHRWALSQPGRLRRNPTRPDRTDDPPGR